MLSIKGLTNSGITTNYFTKDDYYSKDALDQDGRWFGEGAEVLGLSGDVIREEFQSVLEGKLPNGERMGKYRNFEIPANADLSQFKGKEQEIKLSDILSSKGVDGKTIFQSLPDKQQQDLATTLRTSDVVSIEGNTVKVLHHRPGWDLTFSAPKGVSIMAEIGGDKRLFQAHNQAVQKALTYLEKEGLATRVNKDGQVTLEHTGKMVAALFRHDTSRELDPQLHTHSVVMNITERADGKWRALESKGIFDRKMLGGAIYRSELAKSVQQLGYDISKIHEDGRFDISNVPENLKKEFSKRREQIEQALKGSHIADAKAAEQVALNTRSRKVEVDRSELRNVWGGVAKEFGFDAKDMTDKAVEASLNGQTILGNLPGPIEGLKGHEEAYVRSGLVLDVAKEAVQFASAKLGEREAAFGHESLILEAVKHGIGDITISDVQSAIKELASKNDLIHARLDEGKEGWTTRDAIYLERISRAVMKDGIGKTNKITTKREIRKTLSTWGLNKGQAVSATLILNSKDRVVGVQGYAGTGKTFMLGAVREVAENKGFEIVGIAPSSTAANTLELDAGIKSNTLAKHLVDINRALGEAKKLGSPKLDLSKQIWAVDESSMVSNKDMAALLRSAERTGAKVVLIGDTQQLTAVEAGKPFHILQRSGMKMAVMDEIRRQENPQLLAAVKDSIRGHADAAFNKIQDTVYEYSDSAERINAIAKQYLSLSQKDRDQTFVLSPANEDRVKLNEVIRQGLIEEGSVKGDGAAASSILVKSNLTDVEKGRAIFYKPGDTVRFGRAYTSLGVKNGEYTTVESVDRKSGAVNLTNSDGKRIKWKPHQVAAGKGKKRVEIFKKEDRELGKNDKVRWTRNDRDRGVRNAEMAKVVGVNGHNVTFELKDGKQITIDITKPENKHWDHAYANTVHASQGGTVKYVMVNGEDWRRNLVNQKMFYVSLSRAKENAFVYVNDRDKFVNAVKSRTGDKTSALEAFDRDKYQIKAKEDNVKDLSANGSRKVEGNPELEEKKDPNKNEISSMVREGIGSEESHLIEEKSTTFGKSGGVSKDGLIVDSIEEELSSTIHEKDLGKDSHAKDSIDRELGGR